MQLLPFPFGVIDPSTLSHIEHTFTTSHSQGPPPYPVSSEQVLFDILNIHSNDIEVHRDRNKGTTSPVLPTIDEVLEDVDPNSVVIPSRVFVDAAVNTDLTFNDILYTFREDLVGESIRMADPVDANKPCSVNFTCSNPTNRQGTKDENLNIVRPHEGSLGKIAIVESVEVGPTEDSSGSIIVDEGDNIQGWSVKRSCSVM